MFTCLETNKQGNKHEPGLSNFDVGSTYFKRKITMGIKRQDYMNGMRYQRDNPELQKQYDIENTNLFNAYYRQFVTPLITKLVLDRFGMEALIDAYKKDPHFNDHPKTKLQKWDNLEPIIRRYVDQDLIRSLGECWSLSTSVCIAKTAARDIVLNAKKES